MSLQSGMRWTSSEPWDAMRCDAFAGSLQLRERDGFIARERERKVAPKKVGVREEGSEQEAGRRSWSRSCCWGAFWTVRIGRWEDLTAPVSSRHTYRQRVWCFLSEVLLGVVISKMLFTLAVVFSVTYDTTQNMIFGTLNINYGNMWRSHV